ncbi:putative methyltransferase PMT20 [Sesamum angolense]|uniref:Methyltransferase n=1 Tax=Sesamum angolense TaxID=2727404 RepID=A0AAE1WWL1_9LAMI|nr:putative methyltransferase PMT20 [Sesamum angolense]
MKNRDGKPNSQSEKSSRTVHLAIMFVVLCGLSFYLGGIFGSEKNRYNTNDISKVFGVSKESLPCALQVKAVNFSQCSPDLQDYTPCTDPKRWKKFNVHRLAFLERHCPPMFEKEGMLSSSALWNVPYDWINKQKSNQHWLVKEGEKFLFPGGGTMFPNGVSSYVDLMQDLIPEMKDGTIRTAIDTGCGVASWGGDLLDRGILTVSLAPRDNHEAQVQFALERGIPAMLGVISTQRLPFPSLSFDIAHCSRCLIPWTEFGGVYLLEIHRILRPGGFWVLSGPPVNYERRWRGWNTTIEVQRADYEKLQDLLTSMCFELYNKKGDIAVWQKLSDKSCYKKLEAPDYYHQSVTMVTNPIQHAKWPERLNVAPERLYDVRGGSSDAFKHDNKKWEVRAKHYKKLLPALGTDEIRNVMDMNTLYGGFAAAFVDAPLWVMNVVSSYSANTLSVVYDRGLIGTFHDWCEAFSTYPRTYDLLHLDGLFTSESNRCEMKYVLLEMDRILRPNGYALIRESSYFMDSITAIAKGMRWKSENTEPGAEGENILICQKQLWYSSQQSSR